MAVPILYELNQEFTRLFAAGSRLSAGDPHLKKFITPLKKYGEKAPVFLKLAEYTEELLNTDPNQSAQKLIETAAFLLSVLSTQGDTSPSPDDVLTDLSYARNDSLTEQTTVGHRALSPVITALTTTGGGRMEVVTQAFEAGLFKDPRLNKAAAAALGDKYSEIADYMANKVLPSLGVAVLPFLLDGYNVKGGVIDGRRLSVIHKIQAQAMLGMVDEAVDNGSAAVKAEAVRIMSDYPKYESVLITMLDESKQVREEAMKALVKINSKAGIDKLINIYKSAKAETVSDALTYGNSPYLADEMLKTAQDDYLAVKSCIDANTGTADESVITKIQQLASDISVLRNKHTDGTAEFFKTMLSEEYLALAENVLPKDKKQSRYYKGLEHAALEALYYSKKGDDFIWEMFKDTQDGLLDKLFKSKKSKKKSYSKILDCYAFYIGSKKLSPEEFYNMFFKTNLYDEIRKYDYNAFQKTFLQGDNKPAFSDKIARYFVENTNDYHVNLAVQIVSDHDYETLRLLAERLRSNLEKNVFGYVNYEILKRLGETGSKDFNELYELYCSKNHGSTQDKQYLEKFIIK